VDPVTTALVWGAVLVAVAVVVWATLGRTLRSVAPVATELPVGVQLRFFDEPVARLDGVRIGEVVKWRGDLLVGFDVPYGMWMATTTIERGSSGATQQKTSSSNAPLRIPGGAYDARTRRLLAAWRQEGRSVVAVQSRDGRVALIDPECAEALLGEGAMTQRVSTAT